LAKSFVGADGETHSSAARQLDQDVACFVPSPHGAGPINQSIHAIAARSWLCVSQPSFGAGQLLHFESGRLIESHRFYPELGFAAALAEVHMHRLVAFVAVEARQ
jgi:hypothetical protein